MIWFSTTFSPLCIQRKGVAWGTRLTFCVLDEFPCFENGQDRGRKDRERSVVADQKESLEPKEQQE